VAILNSWIGIFSKYVENRALFSNDFGKIPLAPPRLEEGAVFQNSSKTDSYFQHILKICQPVFSKWPQIWVFKEPGFSQGRKMPIVG
jgi:hypothetical protein